MRTRSLLALSLVAVFALSGQVRAEEKDIVDTAVASGKFTTLVAALKAADLVETLKGKGPFTVFAPTDAAFEKLGKDTIAAVLKDKEKLTKILTSHVIAGTVMKADVAKLDGKMVKMLSGAEFEITIGKEVMIGKAKVVITDIKCTNGVIHVIDTVLLPK